MKQITLNPLFVLHESGRPCTGKLLFTWALYGYAGAYVWQLAGPSAAARAVVWGLALVAGLILALATLEL